MHEMHSGSGATSMLAVSKLVKTLVSVNMYGMHCTCVVHRLFKRKVVVSTQKESLGIKSVHSHMLYNCMLLKSCMECIRVVFLRRYLQYLGLQNLNLCEHVCNPLYMCCTSVFETESSCKHTRTKLWHEKYV